MEIILADCFLRGGRTYLHSPDIVSACLSSSMLLHLRDTSHLNTHVVFSFLTPSDSVVMLSNEHKTGATVKIDVFTDLGIQSYFLYPTGKRLETIPDQAVDTSVTFQPRGYMFQGGRDCKSMLHYALYHGKQWYVMNGSAGQIWARKIRISPFLMTGPQQIRGELMRSKGSLDYWVYKSKKGEQLFSILAAPQKMPT